MDRSACAVTGLPRTGARVVETHTATLFFAGDRVYKLKKPVRYPFLDFSTTEAREAACRREVELNARLSPDVYLGVATVLGPDGAVCDHLVVMRRMPDDRRLSRLLSSSEAADRVREVARLVAAFHQRTATSPEIARAGSRDAVRQAWRDNLDEMRPFAGRYLEPGMLSRVGTLALRYLAGRSPLFERRAASGKVRDGHGDLLADDIFCLDDGPRILDCIEFNDVLRHADVASDVAFLAMDLEHRGRGDLAARFLAWYREFSGDNAPRSLLDLYVAHRAVVRSKVACLRADQTGRPSPEAARLLTIAREHLERGRVRLIVVGGLPGTGKTTLAHALAGALGAAHFHSDETRKELAGIPYETHPSAPFRDGIYREEMTAATYARMLVQARSLIGLGESVVLDASWIDASLRDRAAAVAAAASTDLVEFRCVAPPSLAAARIAARLPEGTSSDATASIASAMERSADPWPAAARLDTTLPPHRVLADALAVLDRRPAFDPADSLILPAEAARSEAS